MVCINRCICSKSYILLCFSYVYIFSSVDLRNCQGSVLIVIEISSLLFISILYSPSMLILQFCFKHFFLPPCVLFKIDLSPLSVNRQHIVLHFNTQCVALVTVVLSCELEQVPQWNFVYAVE